MRINDYTFLNPIYLFYYILRDISGNLHCSMKKSYDSPSILVSAIDKKQC